jgi:hypothetical protein
MSRIDKLMNNLSVLKNINLPAGWQDAAPGGTRKGRAAMVQPFDFANWGKVPDKLLAPWSDPSTKDISSNIAPVQFQRIRHNINLWREAIRETELMILPFRVRMQRLFVDTVLNPHVQACMLRRKQLTLLREFDIVDAKDKPIDELTEFFKGQWFADYCSLVLDAQFYGYSLIQLGDITGDEVTNIDLVRRFNVSPDRRCVSLFEYSVSGISFDDPDFAKYLVWVPTPTEIGISKCGYGLLYKIANYELYHRQISQHNADYCEMFVHPFRLAHTNKTQADAEYKNLMAMLDNMGSQAWGIINHNDKLEFISDASGTGWQSYGDFSKRLEGMISKVMLGHADAIDQQAGKLGGGQGGQESPVSAALEDTKTQDGRLIAHNVKNMLIPKLRGLGAQIPDGIKLKYKNDAEIIQGLDKESSAMLKFGQMLQAFKQAGYTLTPEQIKEHTGLDVEISMPPDEGGLEENPDSQNRQANLQNKIRLIYNH